MTHVEEWDPSAASLTEEHRRILTEAARQLDAGNLCLKLADQAKLKSVLFLGFSSWEKFVRADDSKTVVAWIKVLTSCEEKYSGFECGSKSPVISLARVLRKRGTYPSELSNWIKEHSNNRFLPHGSLMDRL
ncbi:MAG: hypothetical protein OXG24_06725 [Gammaproteobacteria bacterium]|nr:hypothetical protein [Gammaproteobacteria bacterium]